MFAEAVTGLKLSYTVLENIYANNFIRVMGEKPHTINKALAVAEAQNTAYFLTEKRKLWPRDNLGYKATKWLRQEG